MTFSSVSRDFSNSIWLETTPGARPVVVALTAGALGAEVKELVRGSTRMPALDS
jgi:hypothetical protein